MDKKWTNAIIKKKKKCKFITANTSAIRQRVAHAIDQVTSGC